MKEQEFLDELKGYLEVLEDEEQEDMIAEYSQHIRMKIESGLSEEEAVRELGPVQELAAEILEAYHIKPGYERPKKKRGFGHRFFASGAQREREEKREWKEETFSNQRGKQWTEKVVSGFWRILGKIWGVIRYGMGTLSRVVLFPFRFGKRAGKWRSGKQEGHFTEITQEKAVFPEENSGGRMERKGWCIAGWIRGLFRWAGGCAAWWFRLGWNFCVMLAAAGAAVCGLIFLYLLGLLSVLWIKGYPLSGIVLGCFGAVLCFASLSALGCTFFWIKPDRIRMAGETGKTEDMPESLKMRAEKTD